jgi:hypothetical protein
MKDGEIKINNIKHEIKEYKQKVKDYKNNLGSKKDVLDSIKALKDKFKLTLKAEHKLTLERNKKLQEYVKDFGFDGLSNDLVLIALERKYGLQGTLFDDKKDKKEQQKQKGNLVVLQEKINDIENGKIYEDAFEWRIEFPEVLDEDGNFLGFDIVLGNPPYIQLQNSGGELANIYSNFSFKTFERTGDIYSLFYEKGLEVLKDNGLLAYITSNKWLRAGYGKSTREFFLKYNPKKLIDLGSGVFDSAAVDSNILFIKKAQNKNKLLACDISKNKELNKLENLKFSILQKLSSDIWAIANTKEQNIKEKIEKMGTPLKEWNIKINYGIKTGFNEAFIIDETKKNELIKKDQKSEEIIKPLLRGKDIRKYEINFAKLYLINSHNNPPINIEKYPAIKEHLDSHYQQLEKRRDKGKTPYNLRSCAYLDSFEKDKIIYPEIASNPNSFEYDVNEYFLDKTAFFIEGKSLKYIISILNSKALLYYMKQSIRQVGQGYQLSKIFVENFPIPKIDEEKQKPFIELV